FPTSRFANPWSRTDVPFTRRPHRSCEQTRARRGAFERAMTSKPIPLQYGGPIPRFEVRSPVNPNFQFDTVAGRHVVLSFFGSARAAPSRRLLEEVFRRRELFDDRNLAFFGVSVDPDDEQSGRVREALPGIHLFWDFDHRVSRLFGASR